MASLDVHPVHIDSGISQFDVFIAGSGPVGATLARFLVDAGYSVVMAEIGDQDTRVPGAHKKNEITFQKDIDRFGALATVSVPSSHTIVPTLDPASWTSDNPDKMSITNGRNPFQEEYNNLGAEAVTRGVGGMSTHWTCATPRFLKGLERPVIFDDQKDDAEWELLYSAAEALIGTSKVEFDKSIRHNVVLRALENAFPTRGVTSLPLACHRLADGSPYVQWHAADNIFGDMFDKPEKINGQGKKRGYFKLLTNTRCTRFILDSAESNQIKLVEVKDLLISRESVSAADFAIQAKIYVAAAGAVATPQILANSGFGGAPSDLPVQLIPNLGARITEQPMAFCQIVLLQTLVDDISNFADKPDWWKKAVEDHIKEHGATDPLPIPFEDPEPQVTIPASLERPWHTQIHRDAFSYGEVGPLVDSRIVVDLRFFGMQPGVPENRLNFETTVSDAYGMPQPTFVYQPSPAAAKEAHDMMNDMTNVASKIGGYLPGSSPQFMTPGLALHLGGTVRAGQGADVDETVANFNSQVWNFKNLYVAGNGVIPTPFGSNPTLTSICLAMRSAYKISEDLKANELTPALPDDVLVPTPEEWVQWLFDKDDPNYPDHKVLRDVHKSV